MAKNGKRFPAWFKAKIALAVRWPDLMVSQLVVKHGMHQTLINVWIWQAVEGMAALFSDKADIAQASHAGAFED